MVLVDHRVREGPQARAEIRELGDLLELGGSRELEGPTTLGQIPAPVRAVRTRPMPMWILAAADPAWMRPPTRPRTFALRERLRRDRFVQTAKRTTVRTMRQNVPPVPAPASLFAATTSRPAILSSANPC